eukprot:g60570.t1
MNRWWVSRREHLVEGAMHINSAGVQPWRARSCGSVWAATGEGEGEGQGQDEAVQLCFAEELLEEEEWESGRDDDDDDRARLLP